MKQTNSKVQMLVIGCVIGMAMAGLLVALVAGGHLGGIGLLAVILLIGLSGLIGWLVGIQRRLRLERHRIWLEGYKEGREASPW